MNYHIIFLFSLLLVNTPMANAFEFQATTLQGKNTRASFEIFAFRGFNRELLRARNYEERLTFTNTESVNIVATINVDTKDVGHFSPLYILALVDSTAYIKTSAGLWVPWNGSLQAVESRTLKAEESLEIVFGLTGISADIDIFIAYGKNSGDVVYNKTPLSLQIKNYSGLITVGEHGQYSGCSGLQLALNTVQDLNEIRIEQGTYACNGLEIASAKKFDFGIKISGGWDSVFQTQTKDPSLTIIDGGAQLIQGFDSIRTCLKTLDTHQPRNCFDDDQVTTTILTINEEPVTIEMLTFKNGYGKGFESGSGAITTRTYSTDIEINRCYFHSNTGTHGGAVSLVNIINQSVFRNNHASSGGAVSASLVVTNSIFNNNSANTGGGALNILVLMNNLFHSNEAIGFGSGGNGGPHEGEGGAFAFHSGFILNNTFVNNTAENIGGAFSGGGVIINSVFSANKAANQDNDINSNGNLLLDYSLFNHLSGGADVGSHNVMEDPLLVDSANDNYRLQVSSPARNVGNHEFLERNTYIFSSGGDVFTYNYNFPSNNVGALIDLDGNNRLQGSAIDMGAYEHQ